MMNTFNTTLSDFTLNEGDLNQAPIYNRIIKRFLENDKFIYGSFGNIPGVWFCKWINDERISGYNTGDFFWLNTQDIGRWMKDNSDQMRDYTNKNPYVTVKLPEWRSNDEEVYEAYYRVLTGYFEPKMSRPMSAMYQLGQLSDRFQIIVSQKDNNKDDPIATLSSWKRFAVNSDEDYENILTMIDRQIVSSLNRHIENYHFGNDKLTEKIFNSLSNYMDEDFRNAKYAYPENFIVNDGECEGMDTVKAYVRKPISPRGGDSTIREFVWFRKWESGFLEHGGLINVTLSNYLTSADYVQVPFDWRLLDENSKAYQVSYIGDDEGSAIEVDESQEKPPGDNLVSVVYELSSLRVDDSEYAPAYSSTDYAVSICPVSETPYEDIGMNAKSKNTVTHTTDIEEQTKKWFRFKYDPDTTTRYYAYYATGFIREERFRGEEKI